MRSDPSLPRLRAENDSQLSVALEAHENAMSEELTEVRTTIDEKTGEVVREIPASQLIKAHGARQVSMPYIGEQYICPNCEKEIPTRKQRNMAKPAKYAHLLADVQRCPFCSFTFAYSNKAIVLNE